MQKYIIKILMFLSWKQGLIIGIWQSFALIPGMSRLGMVISGASFLGFNQNDAKKNCIFFAEFQLYLCLFSLR